MRGTGSADSRRHFAAGINSLYR
ncbi:hypothetical protein TSAR_002396 [Trichomalopsis sarcophagae]|uniref:Uncharacterized protein n=1 Tax=Trichomalopsis sarcophagae TaxID=543379 RepID=A0A232EJD0_9HYME|nr:hypothetical protein TSAR_002396 [Trichomalopsis sarcophagae]